MRELSETEFDTAPSYLRTSLGMPLGKINGFVLSINDFITDKRFDGGRGADCVTFDELAALLRLGSRLKTLVLLLIHCGRLRALDSKRDSGSKNGSARYKIAGGH
jgi:hypothetical protein